MLLSDKIANGRGLRDSFHIRVNIFNRIIIKDALLFISSLKMFTNFMFSIIPWRQRAYGIDIFSELADNEPSGCRRVVRFNSPKQVHLGELRALALGMIGWWDRSKKF